MPRRTLRIATRQSPLALWQARHIANLIQIHWPETKVELVPMLTSGDKFLETRLQKLGGKGLFVKELEEALLAGRADLAVHSMKDMPSQLPEGLCIAAICKRDNPFDALISRDKQRLEDLAPGSRIGTSSLRRQAQLLALRPDCEIKTLRGNVNTRLQKLEAKDYDALVLAASGLIRLKLDHHISDIFDEAQMLPACAQGALGIECRSNDQDLLTLINPLHDPLTRLCVETERRVMAGLGGNCHTPLAIYCAPKENQQLLLRVRVLSADGKICLEAAKSGPYSEGQGLAEACCTKLIQAGALPLLTVNEHH